jgi:polyhydroxyalkanoate synthesis regulator phasin
MAGTVRERLDENVEQAQTLGRKALLAYAGFWGVAYDEARALFERGRATVGDAEQRGEKVEDQVEDQVDDQFEQMVTRVFDRLDIPRRPALLRLEAKVDALDARLSTLQQRLDVLNAELGAQIGQVLARPAPADVARVQELTAAVKQLETSVQEMDASLAEKLTARSAAQVAALVEAAQPLPGYDTKTVDELEKVLPELTVAQLQAVKAYEQAHKDRVTLQRAIDEALDARA